MAAAELFGCRFQVYRNGQIFDTFGQPPMPLQHLRFTVFLSVPASPRMLLYAVSFVLQDMQRKEWDEYFRMKVQWKSVSEEQEMRNSLLRGYRSLIERDVSRTDRNNRFYSGNENPGLTLLNDVLMTYCMYNFDLDSKDSGTLCFCFRWLLIWFKREFSFQDILNLWEHINELTMKLDLKDILCRAESIFKQLEACPDLPSKVRVVLGQASPSEEVGFDRTENSTSSSEDTQPGLPLSEAQTSNTSPTESSIEVLPTPPSEP
ncbi:TBC17 protein, partial [Polypterus senegalus]